MTNSLKSALVDVPVAIIFFNRDDSLKEVYKKIRIARPSKLYLIQDGAREGNVSDSEGIAACRKVFDNIDWECEVYKNYSEINLGCGQRVSSGISWVFEQEDRTVIIEDDCIIEPTFLQFCNELLEKYKDDERITLISGLNHFSDWDCGERSYFFAQTGAIAAWATWKRVWEQFDFTASDFNDEYNQKAIAASMHHKRAAKAKIELWKNVYKSGQKGEKMRFWGPQFDYTKFKTGGMCIVPSHTLSSNVGVNAKATFSGAGLEFMKKSVRGWFFQKTAPMEFPLVHPSVMLVDSEYDKKVYDISYPNKLSRLATRVYYYGKRKIYKIFVK